MIGIEEYTFVLCPQDSVSAPLCCKVSLWFPSYLSLVSCRFLLAWRLLYAVVKCRVSMISRVSSVATIIILVIYIICLYSCTSFHRGIFATRTPHERYEDNLTNAGLKQTALGMQWFTAADKGIRNPLSVSLPYKETGYFAAERPDAAGYVFSCRRGEKLIVTLAEKPTGSCKLFVDLWQYNSNKTIKYLQSADTLGAALSHEIEQDGSYLLRVQPELLCGTEYTLTLTTAPSLAFPVPASAKPNIGSVWGDNRDEGARRHEGIDIFAKFCTPVIAAADGYVTQVNENRLGGKAVFMRPAGKDYVLYYAHLDSQIAREGQLVKTGDTLGLMGNTGNARTTPTHLHFGIYTNGGAINPLPFVEPQPQTPYNITAPLNAINSYVHTTRATDMHAGTSRSAIKTNIPAFSPLHIIAAAANWYKVTTADSAEGFVSSDNIATTSYRKIALSQGNKLYNLPDTAAAARLTVIHDTVANVLGSYNRFYFVRYNEELGWVLQ
jgi:murein DD-endopeptidase MepM/ murein hydrolase activator NlpD